MKQYYAVIDTNVLVSALLSDNLASPTVAILNLVLDCIIVPVYNEEIIREYTEVLSCKKFSFPKSRIDAVIRAICNGMSTDRTPSEWEFPDSDDIVFYEVALSVDEAYLITGNSRHFPPVDKVVTPAEMLKIINGH